jgi:ketosteroid isomerase-like protein
MGQTPEPVAWVQQIYADFVAGNVPGILAKLADDVEWSEPEAGPAPFAGTRHGRDAVARLFQQLVEIAVPEQFEPREFLADGDRVVALGRYRFRVKDTGRTWATEWAMVWSFRDGKVARFRIYKDSAAEAAALRES